MGFIADAKKLITDLELKYRSGVSESTWFKIGGTINFILNRNHQEKTFYMNGPYWIVGSPQFGIDGKAFFEFDAEIFSVWAYSDKPGVSGTTEMDIKIKPQGSGSWTSIFSQTPKFGPTAPADSWVNNADSDSTGIVHPILSSGAGVPLSVNKGDALRLDKISAMFQGENAGIVIHYRPR